MSLSYSILSCRSFQHSFVRFISMLFGLAHIFFLYLLANFRVSGGVNQIMLIKHCLKNQYLKKNISNCIAISSRKLGVKEKYFFSLMASIYNKF